MNTKTDQKLRLPVRSRFIRMAVVIGLVIPLLIVTTVLAWPFAIASGVIKSVAYLVMCNFNTAVDIINDNK